MCRRAVRSAAIICAVLAATAAGRARAGCIDDDTGTRVCLDRPARRVVSLYGAFTELAWEMGATDVFVARTKNDVTIPALQDLPTVGSGLRPNVEYLLALRPDLVIGRAGRAGSRALEPLRARGMRVAAFDPRSFDGLADTIRRLGLLLGRESGALALSDRIRDELETVRTRVGTVARPLRVVFEVRSSSLTVAGRSNLVSELIRVAGGVNPVAVDKKLVHLDVEALLRLDPDVYVVQEGPMNRNPTPPADRPHLRVLRAVRAGRVLVVDEHEFSRPGPRVGKAAEKLSRFLYPERWD